MFRKRRALADDRVAEDEVVHRGTAVERAPWSPAQLVALVIGIIFAVVGGIALAKTGIHSTADAMNREYTNAPLWHHTGWLALGELVFGLLMIGAGVIPGGARGFMTFLGMIALAFGIAVLVAPDSLHRYFGAHDGTGWAFIVTGGISLLAAAVSPVFFTGERVGYGRRREVVA